MSTNLDKEEHYLDEDGLGQKMIWSLSGAGMPEIIRLDINLQIINAKKAKFAMN